MSNDAGQQEPTRPRPTLRIPALTDMRIRRVPFDPPRLRHFRSALAEYGEAIEVQISTDEPIPVDVAVPPALYVGDVALTEMRPAVDGGYVFLALDQERLRDGAPMRLALPGSPPPDSERATFTYQTPE